MLTIGADFKIYDFLNPMRPPSYTIGPCGWIRDVYKPMSSPIGFVDFTTNTIYDPINLMRPIGTIRTF